jgi:hypothetical protein
MNKYIFIFVFIFQNLFLLNNSLNCFKVLSKILKNKKINYNLYINKSISRFSDKKNNIKNIVEYEDPSYPAIFKRSFNKLKKYFNLFLTSEKPNLISENLKLNKINDKLKNQINFIYNNAFFDNDFSIINNEKINFNKYIKESCEKINILKIIYLNIIINFFKKVPKKIIIISNSAKYFIEKIFKFFEIEYKNCNFYRNGKFFFGKCLRIGKISLIWNDIFFVFCSGNNYKFFFDRKWFNRSYKNGANNKLLIISNELQENKPKNIYVIKNFISSLKNVCFNEDVLKLKYEIYRFFYKLFYKIRIIKNVSQQCLVDCTIKNVWEFYFQNFKYSNHFYNGAMSRLKSNKLIDYRYIIIYTFLLDLFLNTKNESIDNIKNFIFKDIFGNLMLSGIICGSLVGLLNNYKNYKECSVKFKNFIPKAKAFLFSQPSFVDLKNILRLKTVFFIACLNNFFDLLNAFCNNKNLNNFYYFKKISPTIINCLIKNKKDLFFNCGSLFSFCCVNSPAILLSILSSQFLAYSHIFGVGLNPLLSDFIVWKVIPSRKLN